MVPDFSILMTFSVMDIKDSTVTDEAVGFQLQVKMTM